MSATFLVDPSTAFIAGMSVAPQTISSATTTNGTGVDLLNGDGRVFALVLTGDCGDASTVITTRLEESADNSTSWTTIAGSTVTRTASATANDNTYWWMGSECNRTKRYVRAVVVTASGTPSVIIAAGIMCRKHIAGSSNGALTTF